MLLDTSREGVKKAFEYLVRLPFTKPLLHRINEAARGKCIAYFSLHRILENTPDLCSHPHRIAKTALTLDEARKILEQIKKTLYFVSLKESLDYLLGHISLERSVAVLFIEAPYVQTLKNLVPLARELEIPLTVAVSTNSLLTGEPLWMDEISYRVINTPKEELAINFIDRSFTLTNSQERFAAAQHIINNLSNCSAPTLRSRLNHLRETLHETAILPTSERIATTAQLLKFSHDDVTYIIAGNEHLPFLALLDEERADRELSVAKLELQAMLGDVLLPVYFYPLGVDKRHQPDITKLLINSSFTAAISRNVGVCRPGDNMFRLVRVPLGLDGKSFEQFELQGLADAIDEFLLVTLAHNEGL